jgi:hypothetical protein
MSHLALVGLCALPFALQAAYRGLPHWKAGRAANARRKAYEVSETAVRQQVIAEAEAVAVPDAVFLITRYNRNRKHPWRIDLLAMFPNESPAILAGWEKRSEQLLLMGHRVGRTVGITGRGDIELTEQNVRELNPGFSEQTYARTVRRFVDRPDI